MNKIGILQTRDEQFYFIDITILSIFITIGIVAFSHNWFPYPIKIPCALIDVLRRVMVVFFSTVTFLYVLYVIKFKRGHWWFFPIAISIAFAFSPLLTNYLSLEIEECNKLTFEESHKGAVYIWNEKQNDGINSENIRILMFKLGHYWNFPYPMSFFLEFNTSVYPECQLYYKKHISKTTPDISFYNNNSGVTVSWRDEDLDFRNLQFSVWWIDFIVNWSGTNNEIAEPERYGVVVNIGEEIDVCVGILYHNPDKKGQNFYNWYQQINDYEKKGTYSSKQR